MGAFLWSQGQSARGKAKVAWKAVCLPRNEGGLGIGRLTDMNKSLMASHVWSILTKRDSLWVQWVYDYRLKGRSFWDVPIHAGISWGWRKLLQLRESIRPHVRSKIGNGRNSSMWYDSWSNLSPIIQHVTPRAIANAGFSIRDKICDLIQDGQWKFPTTWYDLFPVLISLPCIDLQYDRPDVLAWRDHTGHDSFFSSSTVWESIRYRSDPVSWADMVWFPQCIPRHSFHIWLVMRKKLKTQDRMKAWDVGSETNLRLMYCPLCQNGIDSHSHLFFECIYSTQVWGSLKQLVGMQNVSNSWDDVVAFLCNNMKHNSARLVIAKLMVAATSLYLAGEECSSIH